MTARASRAPTYRRPNGERVFSETDVLAAMHECRPRFVVSGRGHRQLPGVTVVDITRALGSSYSEQVRPALACLVAQGRLVAVRSGPYICYLTPDPSAAP